MLNGCVCCTVRGDLVKVLKKFQSKKSSFAGIIIETTGMADPAPVAQTFFVGEDVRASYHLDSLITVVDAKHILEHVREEKPEGVENESVEQIAFADRILLNKCDLVHNEKINEVIEAIKSTNKNADVIQTKYSKVDPQKLLNIGAFDVDRVVEMDPEFLNTDGDHQHDLSISSTSVRFEGELNMRQLLQWIRKTIITKSQDLCRYKGVLAIAGSDAKHIFQGVHMLFAGKLESAHLWKDDEVRECRFVFIGRNLNKEEFQKGMMDCKAGPLRFDVSDDVEVCVKDGVWLKGCVYDTWSEGYPYSILKILSATVGIAQRHAQRIAGHPGTQIPTCASGASSRRSNGWPIHVQPSYKDLAWVCMCEFIRLSVLLFCVCLLSDRHLIWAIAERCSLCVTSAHELR